MKPFLHTPEPGFVRIPESKNICRSRESFSFWMSKVENPVPGFSLHLTMNDSAMQGFAKNWLFDKEPRGDRQPAVLNHVNSPAEKTKSPREYWDSGLWIPLQDPWKGFAAGLLKFDFLSHKLTGHWALIRTQRRSGLEWLFLKEKTEFV